MRIAGRWLGVAAALCAVAAQAHIVYGTKTLRGLVAEADLVVHARIVSTDQAVSISTERGPLSRPAVEAESVAVLKGSLEAERVRFVQHGHGVATFSPGDETLLFLIDIDRSRELRALARSGAVQWASLQEHSDAYPVVEATRAALLGAIRAYAGAEGASPEARQAELRRATVGLITSGDSHLAASALRDLVAAREAELVTPADVPALRSVLADPAASMGVRAALLTELGRRRLLDPGPVWLELLAEAGPTRDRITAIRAAGASAGPSVRPRLVALLADPDADVAAAAAAALGRPRDDAAVAALAGALSRGDAKVRTAAIRGLGRIGTPAADRALEEAAKSHDDPGTRRRARSELDKRARAAGN